MLFSCLFEEAESIEVAALPQRPILCVAVRAQARRRASGRSSCHYDHDTTP